MMINLDCLDEAKKLLESKGYRICGSAITWPAMNTSGPCYAVPDSRMRSYPDYSLQFTPSWLPEPETLKSESIEEIMETIRSLPDATAGPIKE